MEAEVLEFLEHFGVRGQKWGVRKQRRAVEREARRDRFKSGKETARDKLIRDLDFDRSSAERRADTKLLSSKQKATVAGAAIVTGLLMRKIGLNSGGIMGGAVAGGVAARAIMDSMGKTTTMDEIRVMRLRG